jgi:glutaminyl-tRNA synthetase
VHLYEHLFLTENPDDETDGTDYKSKLNPDSLRILSNCMVEPGLQEASLENRYQFLRQGYFCLDLDSRPGKLVFNRIVSLRDSWAKAQKA